MKRPSRDEEREQRITMEIVVDAYTPEEQAMGWYYSLEGPAALPVCGPVHRRARHLAAAGR
jgi:Calcium binding